MQSASSSSAFSNDSFRKMAQLAYDESGIILTDEKKAMVQSRLRNRISFLEMRSFDDYQKFVCSESGSEERRFMISALTTNVSNFFREPHHFDILLEYLANKVSSESESIRLWSAGCSNGQEAYTMGMLLRKHVGEIQLANTKILATDIDPIVVDFAKRSTYSEKMIDGVPQEHLSEFFLISEDGKERKFKISEDIRSMTYFNELNLLSPWPITRKFDVIFCRNVVIYFDAVTQNSLWPRFRAALKDGGLLMLGHSERISKPEMYNFESAGPTTYKAVGSFNLTKQIEQPEE